VDAIFASLKSRDLPGAAVVVIQNGRIVFERGYGVTDLRTRRPIDGHTDFRLASVTKQFTAMAIMLLVHDGKLRYETRLTDILPDFPDYGREITIRQLLNHTSGLKDYEDLMPKDYEEGRQELRQIQDGEVLELLEREKTTNFAPGTKWAYSNSGYVLLGIIVGKVSGEPFAQFLNDRIFVPLHMTYSLAYVKGTKEVPNRAYGHSNDSNSWHETDQSPTSATLGDGGVYSSVEDLAKWDAALQKHMLLGPAEMEPALTPVKVPEGQVTEPDGRPAEYGFGWFLNPYRGHKRMWHYGETMGFRTAIQRFVDDKLTVVVLCNRSDLDPTALALKVADVYFAGER
jgi:CubicO group peptidase (beta-lactamase class C family)